MRVQLPIIRVKYNMSIPIEYSEFRGDPTVNLLGNVKSQ